MNVTIYEGFNKNRGDYSLETILNGIRGGRWRKTVDAIREALSTGNTAGADRLKKSLPAFTFSATYKGSRKKDSITHYTGLIMLDVDKLDADEVDPVVWKAMDCPYTVFCFRSPSGRGVKIGVDPLATGCVPLTGHSLTLENHKATFRVCAIHYEGLLGVPVDPSGKDAGRLCFVGYDENLYFNREALRAAKERITAGVDERVAEIASGPAAKEETPGSVTEAPVTFSVLSRLKSIRMRTTSKCGRYAEGNRNNYVFRFACFCAGENIPKQEAMAYCRNSFKDLSETEMVVTVDSGYRTVAENPPPPPLDSRQKKQAKQKERNDELIRHTEDWLNKKYLWRFNVITRFVEYRHRERDKGFQSLDDQTENSIWRALQHDGISVRLPTLHTILMSDFCPDYDPFRDYFESLPVWDGKTDYILRLAGTVEVENAELWYRALRRFLVAMVGSALDRNVVNHTVLVLASDQGKGKTTWCLNLIPPELQAYRFSGIPDPRSKDSAVILARCLLVNLDELGTLSMRELNPLKEMITKSVIHLRPAYGRNMEHFPRIASFTGSVNSVLVFPDQTGLRRWACFEARRIDYLSPVDYEGVYSQVMSLLRGGFRFWLDDAEIEEMNVNNESFRIRTPEEEIFHTWVRKPQEGETEVEYLTSAQILAFLCIKVPLQMSKSALTTIGMILKKEGFKYFFKQNKRVYAVRFNTPDEVNADKKEKKDKFTNDAQDDDK